MLAQEVEQVDARDQPDEPALVGHHGDMVALEDRQQIADEYDDKLMKKYGGQRMIDLLEETAMERIMEKDPSKFKFDD